MFSQRSRYAGEPIDTVVLADGHPAHLVRFPVRPPPRLAGYHRLLEGQTLDQLANYYLKDPTRFWALCDANGACSPHALAVADLVAIPARER